MLLSMTGYGEARRQDERGALQVEIRTVNNRHLKLTAKLGEPFAGLEADLERLVRETIRRGSVQLNLRVDRQRDADEYRLNLAVLAGYRDQLQALRPEGSPPIDPVDLIGLPGVVADRRAEPTDPQEHWPTLASIVAEALVKLQESRADEGRAMAAELVSLAETISGRLERIAERGPEMIVQYEQRLLERVRSLVENKGVTLEPRDVIREVAIFAERSDIAEEVVRLRSHLQQFLQVIDEPESAGRKLEFIVQEMGRETNTIGSKANDIEITREVVEIKGMLEKIRELIQNVE